MLYTVTNRAEPIDWRARGNNRVLQNIANLLRAWRGTIPFRWDLGLDPDIQHAAAGAADARITLEVDRNITRYAPDAQLVAIRVSHPEDGLLIEVDVEVDVS